MRAAQSNVSTDVDVVVIGSGLAGLTAATALARRGLRTVVLEQNDSAGGAGGSFVRDGGLRFDIGVHAIGDAGPGGRVRRILDDLEVAIELRELDPDALDVVHLAGETIPIPVGWERYRTHVAEAAAADRTAVHACIGAMQSIATEARAAREPRADPGVVLPGASTFARHGLRPLAHLFDAFGLGPRARALLSVQGGNYALPPSQVAAVAHATMLDDLLAGAAYPRGGGGALAEALVAALRASGGEVRLRSAVTGIVVEAGRAVGVRTACGQRIGSRTVISNADPRTTLLRLVDPGALGEATRRRAARWRSPFPLFGVYVVVEGDLRDRLGRSSHWILPDDDVERHYRLCAEGLFPEEPAVYLTAGGAKDPGSAIDPAGTTALELFSIAPAVTAGWRNGERTDPVAYDELKRAIEDRMLAIAGRVVPGLAAAVRSIESAAPPTFARFLGSPDGSGYGIALTCDQIGARRPDVETDLPGLYLAGAGTRFGHGVPAVLSSGMACAERVARALDRRRALEA